MYIFLGTNMQDKFRVLCSLSSTFKCLSMTLKYCLKKFNIHTNTHTHETLATPTRNHGRQVWWQLEHVWPVWCMVTVNDYRNGQGEADLQLTRGALKGRAKIKCQKTEHVHWLHQKDRKQQRDIKIAKPSPFVINELYFNKYVNCFLKNGLSHLWNSKSCLLCKKTCLINLFCFKQFCFFLLILFISV